MSEDVRQAAIAPRAAPHSDDPHSIRWAADQARIACRAWPDEVVVFDRRDGDTHILSGLSAALMRELLRGPQAFDAIAGAVVAQGACGGTAADVAEQIRAVLADLSRKGIVVVAAASCVRDSSGEALPLPDS